MFHAKKKKKCRSKFIEHWTALSYNQNSVKMNCALVLFLESHTVWEHQQKQRVLWEYTVPLNPVSTIYLLALNGSQQRGQASNTDSHPNITLVVHHHTCVTCWRSARKKVEWTRKLPENLFKAEAEPLLPWCWEMKMLPQKLVLKVNHPLPLT